MSRTIFHIWLGIVRKHAINPLVVVALVMMLSAALFSWMFQAYVLEKAEENITNLLLSHKGIHHYVQKILIPAYAKYQAEGKIPATFYAPELLSSSFIVRNQHVFYNQERKDAGFPELYYKLAAKNPRNPVNKADALEENLIKMFNEHRDVKSYKEIIEVDGKKILYVAIPFLDNQPHCMRCHGKREDSPTELQQRYPGQGGFNEKLGEIRAITSIRAPVEQEYMHIYIIGVAIFVGCIAFVGLFFFNTQLRSLVQKKTTSLEQEIEERKQAEEEQLLLEARLRQSQKMEAIGTLAGGIAHDFNNILSIIFGYTELAILEEDPEKRGQDLEQVRMGAERAKELVTQILTFSRRTELATKQPLQVAVVIKEALRMLRSSIPTTIEIRQEIASDGTVLADPTQIHQLIMNLCTNAYQAMRETGGSLAVSLVEIEIRQEDEGYGVLVPGRYLKLVVSDTGCGISHEIQEKIFEPYFTTKATGEGTGLGLAVVLGIVRGHNGHITVYSEPGKGATFHVYLPLVEATAAVALPAQEVVEDLTGKGERLLFVDDEALIREFADRLFALHGYQVTSFSNGVQALEEFQSHPDQFDLVITDMTMPYMTGAELAQKILGIRPDMPVILCTGQSELINREKALAMGICGYLNKPVLKHDFLSAIRRALEKKNHPAYEIL